MTYSWKPMGLDDFVAYQRLMGLKVVQVDGRYWREVRPFFYWPLLSSQVIPVESSSRPPGSRFFGTQYAVASAEEGNSYLNYLSFENKSGYSLESLHRNWKRKVRHAAKNLVIRPIQSASEFSQHAHPAYLSFYARTRYQVRTERRDPAYFAKWAEALFRISNLLILGGYNNDKMGGVSVSFLLDRTLVYATFFCDDESLDLHLPDLMLHAVRESAAASPDIDEVFASMYKGGGGLDSFYLARGAKVMKQPARLELNPVMKFVFRHMLPKQYSRLLGHIPEQPASKVGGMASPQAKKGLVDSGQPGNLGNVDLPPSGRVPPP